MASKKVRKKSGDGEQHQRDAPSTDANIRRSPRKPTRKQARYFPLPQASPARLRRTGPAAPRIPSPPLPPPPPALPSSFMASRGLRDLCKPLRGYDDAEGRRIALRIRMLEAFAGQEPKGFQLDAVLAILKRRDVMVRAATGSGKSRVAEGVALNFSLGECVVIVLVPLEELGNDQVAQKRRAGFSAVNITDRTWNAALARRIADCQEQFVYLSPERFNKNSLWRTTVMSNPKFASRVQCVCIDEAYLVYQWGLIKTGRQKSLAVTRHDRGAFHEDYSQIATHRRSLSYTPLLLLSATMTPQALSLICNCLQLNETDLITFSDELYRPNLRLIRAPAKHSIASALDATRLLAPRGSEATKRPTIVYTNTRKFTGDVVKALHNHVGMDPNQPRSTLARRYHSVTADTEKSNFLRDFRRGHFPFAVATSALGLGMNLRFVRMVVQLGMCPAPNLFQRWGRVRDNQPGLCLLFTRGSPAILDDRRSGSEGEEPSDAEGEDEGEELDEEPSNPEDEDGEEELDEASDDENEDGGEELDEASDNENEDEEEVAEGESASESLNAGSGEGTGKGETAGEQERAMKALETTRVCLWVALLLYLRTGIVPTDPSASSVKSELARITAISPCECSVCDPDAAAALVDKLGIVTNETFFDTLRDPIIFSPGVGATTPSCASSPASTIAPAPIAPHPAATIRRLAQHITEAQIIDLRQRLLTSYRTFFAEAYGTPGSSLLPADTFFDVDAADKLACGGIGVRVRSDVESILGRESIVGMTDRLFGIVTEWRAEVEADAEGRAQIAEEARRTRKRQHRQQYAQRAKARCAAKRAEEQAAKEARQEKARAAAKKAVQTRRNNATSSAQVVQGAPSPSRVQSYSTSGRAVKRPRHLFE